MLPLRPRPQPEEIFASWVNRTAVVNGLAVEDFVKIIRERYAGALSERRFYTPPALLQRVNPDSVEHEQFIVMMAAATGLTEEFLNTFTLRLETRRYSSRFLTPAGRVKLPKVKRPQGWTDRWHADSYCPECLAQDFYLRRSWRAAFPCVCLVHARVLMDRCPACQAVLNFYGEHGPDGGAIQNGAAFRCWNCRLDLALVPRHPPAQQHLNVVRFLYQLYEGEIPVPVGFTDTIIVCLNIFHWWMESFLETGTTLPVSPLFPYNRSNSVVRAAYAYQPSRVAPRAF